MKTYKLEINTITGSRVDITKHFKSGVTTKGDVVEVVYKESFLQMVSRQMQAIYRRIRGIG